MKLLQTRVLLFAMAGPVIAFSAGDCRSAEPDYRRFHEIEAQHRIVGPLVGHVTDTTARIWAYAGPTEQPLVLEIAELGSTGADQATEADAKAFHARLEQAPDPDEHYAVEFLVEGLRPLTRYAFAVRMEGDDAAVAPGVFATAPAAGRGGKFRVAITSCFGNTYRRENGRTVAKREYVNGSWQFLLERRPDLQLLIGDNVYADSTDYNHLWDSHTLERVKNAPFAESIRTMPTLAVWDDHDYGPNDGDGTAAGKEQSLEAFGEVFANPPRQGGGGPGVYTSFSWGGVDFFLLDCRYHRSPNEEPDTEQKKLLGDEQLQWLVAQLKQSKAPFKLLVNGSTWDTSKDDGWRLYSHERQRLWRTIVANQIHGVVFVSGDIHRCDLPLHWPDVNGAYLMPEITSSGLGSHGEHDPLAFVYVDFDTTAADPTMTAHVIDGKNCQTMMRMVRASDLTPRELD